MGIMIFGMTAAVTILALVMTCIGLAEWTAEDGDDGAPGDSSTRPSGFAEEDWMRWTAQKAR
jgi:hypothetical protein